MQHLVSLLASVSPPALDKDDQNMVSGVKNISSQPTLDLRNDNITSQVQGIFECDPGDEIREMGLRHAVTSDQPT